MKYSKRELRAVDILAMVLSGIGALCFLLAFFVWTQGGQWGEITPKGPRHLFLGYVIGGLVIGCSGLSLDLKLREMQTKPGRRPSGGCEAQREMLPGSEAPRGSPGGAGGLSGDPGRSAT